MGSSAAMVQAKVVKGGGAGGALTDECAKIFQCFDPEIKFGPHSKMQGSLDDVEKYDPKNNKGYQAEHVPPAGTLHQSGRGVGPDSEVLEAIEGSDYSTSSATTWMVHDGQGAGTEHRILTDNMREFSQTNQVNDEQATLKEWLSKYKDGVKNALSKAVPKRRIKKPPDLDEEELIAKAADCIETMAAAYFKEAGVDENAKLRNFWKATKAQIQEAAEAEDDY